MAFETSLAVKVDSKGARIGAAEVNQALGSVENRARRLVNQTSGAFDKLRRSIFSVQSAVIALGGALVIREFAQFEKALIGVGKTANLSGAELEAMGRRVQIIAREVPIATTELLGIAQAAGQLGVQGSDNIAIFTETVGKLGLASDLAGEEAATTLARILTVTKTSVSEVDRLGAAIVDLGNNFAATEAEIAGVATRVAQSTALFGTSTADVLGVATALKAVGVEAEAGGTVVGRAFQAIDAALRSGGEHMEVLQKITGQTREELIRAFGDSPTRVFQSFVEGLGRISKSGGDVSGTLKDMDLEGVRVVQVLGTLATGSDVLSAALDRSNKAYEQNVALDKEAAAAAKSFAAQMQLIFNIANEVAVAIGKQLAPAVLEAISGFRDFVTSARGMQEIEAVAKRLGSIALVLAENIDKVVIAVSALIGLRLGAAFGPWGAAAGLLVGALGGLKLVLDDIKPVSEQINDEIDETQRLAESATKNIEGLTKAERDRTQALIAEAKASIELGDAEIRRLENSKKFGVGIAAESREKLAINPQIEESRRANDEARQRIRDLETALRASDATAFGGFAIPPPSTPGGRPFKPKPDDEAKKQKELRDLLKEVSDLSKAETILFEANRDGLLELDAARGRAILSSKAFFKALGDENRVLALIADGREKEIPQLRAEAQLREALGRELLPKEIEQIKALVNEREKLNEKIKANEEANRKAMEQAKQFERIWEHALENIQDEFASAFRDALDGQIKSFEDFGDRVVDIMKEAAAQAAAAWAAQSFQTNFGSNSADGNSSFNNTSIGSIGSQTEGAQGSINTGQQGAAGGIGGAAIAFFAASILNNIRTEFSSDTPPLRKALLGLSAIFGPLGWGTWGIFDTFFGDKIFKEKSAIGRAFIGSDNGQANLSAIGRTGGFNKTGIRSFGNSAVDIINNFLEEFELSLVDETDALLRNKNGEFQTKIPGLGGFKGFRNFKDAVQSLIGDLIGAGFIQGLDDAVVEKVREIGGQAGLEFLQARIEMERQLDAILSTPFDAALEALRRAERSALRQARELLIDTDKVKAAFDKQFDALFESTIAPLRQLEQLTQFGPLSVLSPGEQLSAARGAFNDVVSRARAGEISDLSQVLSAGQNLLTIGQQNFASGPKFAEIFREVNRASMELQELFKQRFEDVQRQAAETTVQAVENQTDRLEDKIDQQTNTLGSKLDAITQELEFGGR